MEFGGGPEDAIYLRARLRFVFLCAHQISFIRYRKLIVVLCECHTVRTYQ